jgi:hypothetical protein
VPSLSLTDKKLKYTAADYAALEKAFALLSIAVQYDEAAKQDAQTAMNAMGHVMTHVAKQRNGKPEAPVAGK